MDGIIHRWLGGGNEPVSALPPAPAGSRRLLETTADASHSYFTFSLAIKKDEVITALEWQLKLGGSGRKA